MNEEKHGFWWRVGYWTIGYIHFWIILGFIIAYTLAKLGVQW